jgi:hypothetical protein
MVNHPPYSVVLTYTEDPQQLTMQAVDSVKLVPLVRGFMEVPFFWTETSSSLTTNWRGSLEWQCSM